MDNMLLSFIIPVYNVALWLRECLDSVLAIPGNEWEAIIVNDGSTDDSPAILKDYEGESRFQIVHTPNRGLSAARNEGLRHAKGDYIAFLDSDDLLDPVRTAEMIAKLDGRADIVCGNYIVLKGNADAQQAETAHALPEGLLCDGRQFLLKHYRTASSVVWRSFYRRELVKPFHEGVRFEDVEWSIRAYHSAAAILCTGIPFYIYRLRGGSITSTSADAKTLDDACTVCESLLEDAARMEDKAAAHVYEREGLHCAIFTAFRARKSIGREGRRKFRSFLRGKKTSGLRYTVILALSKNIFSF